MEQIRLRTLLKEDEIFREWFKRPPTIEGLSTTPPWRLYIQAEEGGRWARGDLRTYAKAYAEVNSRLRDAWDMTIHCKSRLFKPPVIKKGKATFWLPTPEGHDWCCYCRRAVVFRTFTHHPAIKYGCDPEILRCTICGARQISMPRTNSILPWPAKQPSTKS
jgi:hypothetical protein